MFTDLLIHQCFVNNGESKDKRLYFDQGSVEFDAGRLLTGAVSFAEGIIKSYEVTTGLWGAGTATGYVILKNCVGNFINDEIITDNQPSPGTAVSNGASAYNEDEFGYVSTSKEEYLTRCRFNSPSGGLMVIESGEHLVKRYRVIFPPDITIAEGSIITGNGSTGYQGSYRVENVDYIYNGSSLHHIGCDVKEVE